MSKMQNLIKDIDTLAADWDISGFYVIIHDGEIIMNHTYGYADRQTNREIGVNDTYCLSLRSKFLLGTAVMQLCEKKLLALDDTIDKFIPEYKFANKITVRRLFDGSSGTPDFFAGYVVSKHLDNDAAHNALTKEERYAKEVALRSTGYAFSNVISMINELPLEFEPGDHYYDCITTDMYIVAEIIKRVSNLSLFEYMKQYIFEPCKMTDVVFGNKATTASRGSLFDEIRVSLPHVECQDCITVGASDIMKLMEAFRDVKLMSKKSWVEARKFSKDSENCSGIGFETLNGYIASYDESVLGYTISFCINERENLMYFSVLSELPVIRLDENDNWCSFRPLSRKLTEGAFQKLTKPRFVKITKQNLWNAMDLTVTKKQKAFVSTVKESICYAYVDKNEKPFILMDCNRAIGVLVLHIDKKKGDYEISIVLIDKRFQSCGYGKFMLRWAVDKLKAEGAKKLEIGVNRSNEVARHLYESVGFSAKNVYDGGVRMEMNIE